MKMFLLIAFVALCGITLAMADDEKSRAYTFGKDDVGKAPPGWKIDKTGKGDGSVWKVVEDNTAPSKKGYVLAQTAEGPSPLYNLCVADDAKFKDVEISVAFKAIKGMIDQGGGVVWRYQDPENYYIARMNPLEKNYRVYKVVAGKRIQLGTKENIDTKAGEWHTLRIEHRGAKGEIECYLDGKKLLSVDNETAIDRAGKVGLWTKADAQTYFDKFEVKGK